MPDPQAPPRLTDRNPGSILRTLAESFAREYAVVSRQLERVYDEAFIETADGRALDQLVALVGVTRRTQLFAVGEVVFSRLTPAPGDVTIEAGTPISTERRAVGHRRHLRDAHAAHRPALDLGAGAGGRAGLGRDRRRGQAHRDPPADPRHHGGHEPGRRPRSAARPRPTTRCAAARAGRSRTPARRRPPRSSARSRRSRASPTRTSRSPRTTSARPARSRSPSPRPTSTTTAPGSRSSGSRRCGPRACASSTTSPCSPSPSSDPGAGGGRRGRAAAGRRRDRRLLADQGQGRRDAGRARRSSADEKVALVGEVEAAIQRLRRRARRRPAADLQPARRRDPGGDRRVRRDPRRLPGVGADQHGRQNVTPDGLDAAAPRGAARRRAARRADRARRHGRRRADRADGALNRAGRARRHHRPRSARSSTALIAVVGRRADASRCCSTRFRTPSATTSTTSTTASSSSTRACASSSRTSTSTRRASRCCGCAAFAGRRQLRPGAGGGA